MLLGQAWVHSLPALEWAQSTDAENGEARDVDGKGEEMDSAMTMKSRQ